MPTDDELIKSKIGLDTTDAKAAVAELNRGIRVLESGFRASAAGLGDWASSANGLEMRAKSLSGQIELQQRKVQALTKEYERVAKEKGDTSKAALDLQIKINKETESLNKMQGELGQTNRSLDEMQSESKQSSTALTTLDKKQEEAAKSSDKLKNKSGGLKAALSGVKGVALAVGAAIGAMLAGIGAMVIKSSDAAGEMVDMSLKTGVNVERLQELRYIGNQVGVDLDTMAGSWSRLTRTIGSAAEGGVDANKTFKTLGISIRDQNGNLRDSKEIWQEALTALGGIENETQRDILSNSLFGKSYADLNPLIKTSADEIARLTDEAHRMGAVTREEDVLALEEFGDSLAGLKDSAMGMLGTVTATLLPGLNGIVGGVQGYLLKLQLVFLKAGGDPKRIAYGIGGLLGQIVTEIASKAPAMVAAGLALIQSLLNSIVSALPGLVPIALQIVMMLIQFILQNIPMLLDVGIQILMALITGLTTALPVLIAQVAQLIPQIVTTLLQNLPMIINAALSLIMALAMGLIAALPVLIPEIPKIVQQIVTLLINDLPMIILAALQIVTALAMGLIENLPLILKAIVDIIAGIIQTFGETDWGSIGDNIVAGLQEGFVKKWKAFKDNVSSLFKELWKYVKGLLGISSPSKLFADIGLNMAAGLGVGWSEQFKDFAANVGKDFSGLTGPTLALQGAGAGTGGNGRSLQVIVQATVASDVDIHKLGRLVVEEIRRNQ